MIFCKQNALSDIFLTFENDCYILAIRSNPPKTCSFNDKTELIEIRRYTKGFGHQLSELVVHAIPKA